MTIKFDDLVWAEGNDASNLYAEGESVIPDKEDALAMLRHIFRDRSDIDQMPVINGFIGTFFQNQWGHNTFIDVTYSKKGYRATYGGYSHKGKMQNVVCYMD